MRMTAATVSCAPLGTTESRFLMKWTRHRCQEAPGDYLGDRLTQSFVGIGDHTPWRPFIIKFQANNRPGEEESWTQPVTRH